eukprot:535632-Prorocentrum_minimum.AAC.4
MCHTGGSLRVEGVTNVSHRLFFQGARVRVDVMPSGCGSAYPRLQAGSLPPDRNPFRPSQFPSLRLVSPLRRQLARPGCTCDSASQTHSPRDRPSLGRLRAAKPSRPTSVALRRRGIGLDAAGAVLREVRGSHQRSCAVRRTPPPA